jgi:hypothetical protein
MENNPKLAVPAEVKAERRNEVMETQQKLVFARNEAIAAKFDEKHPLDKQGRAKGHVVDVVIDAPLRTSGKKTTGVSEGGKLYQARTKSQAPQIDGVTFVQSKDKRWRHNAMNKQTIKEFLADPLVQDALKTDGKAEVGRWRTRKVVGCHRSHRNGQRVAACRVARANHFT